MLLFAGGRQVRGDDTFDMNRPRLFRMGRVIPGPRLRPLGPVGLAGAGLGGVLLALAAFATLGLALLLRPRLRPGRRASVGGGAPRSGAGATARGERGAASHDDGADSRRDRSYAEV